MHPIYTLMFQRGSVAVDLEQNIHSLSSAWSLKTMGFTIVNSVSVTLHSATKHNKNYPGMQMFGAIAPNSDI